MRTSDSDVVRPSVMQAQTVPLSSSGRKIPPSASAHTLVPAEKAMSPEQLKLNPEVDYTRYGYFSNLFINTE